MARPAKKILSAVDLLALPRNEQARAKLEEVRTSRKAAEAKGAFTGVPALHKIELQILDDIARLPAGEDVSDMSVDELVDVLVAVIPELTPAAASRLEAALSARPPHLRLASGGV